MKKLNFLAGLFGLLIVIGGISCASAPPPAEEPPAPAPVQPAQPARDPNLGPPDQAALNSLAEAKSRAEEARKLAFDFGGPQYAAADWEAADALYSAAAGQEARDTLGHVKEAVARYEQAASAFNAVFNTALPLYAGALEDEILQARAAALDAGIALISPDHLEKADGVVDQALGLYEAKEYYPANDAGHLALDMFRLLKTGADTYKVWEEIESYDFAKYDASHYDAAMTAALAALDGYDALSGGGTGDNAELFRNAEEAQTGFNTVLATAWRTYAAERQAAAGVERQKALDLKANVAVRDDYGNAQALYDQAQTSFRATRYTEAAATYFRAEFLFAAAAETAAEKRRLAEATIREAEDKNISSDETARQAEVVIRGGN
jgi:hypothetical protein